MSEDEKTSESMLSSLIALAPVLAARAEKSFEPLVTNRSRLRKALKADGRIYPFPATPDRPVPSMAAIDGARVREQMYAADLLVAVAGVANARTAETAIPVASSTWADIVPHTSGTDRLSEAAMCAQEVTVAARAPHAIRILDGSFQTPVIALREGLYLYDNTARDGVADLITGPWDPAAALGRLIEPSNGVVLAVPKSDSSDRYAAEFSERYNMRLTVTDRFLATQVLEPGEMLAPRPLHEFTRLTVDYGQVRGDVAMKAAELLRTPVRALAAAAKEQRAWTTYFKPHGSFGPGAVLRVEFLTRTSGDLADASARAAAYATILGAETPTPHMLEPFAQWAVDQVVKEVSSGTRALRATLSQYLTGEHADAYAALLATGYRT